MPNVEVYATDLGLIGDHVLVVTASMNGGAFTETATWKLTIIQANTGPPELKGGVPSFSIEEGEEKHGYLNVIEPDGDLYFVQWSNLPSFAKGTQNKYSFTPEPGDSGSYTIGLKLQDVYGEEMAYEMIVEINVPTLEEESEEPVEPTEVKP